MRKHYTLSGLLLCLMALFTLGTSATPDKDYLCFTANEALSKVRLSKYETPTAVTIQYSTDNGASWTDVDFSTETTTGDIFLTNVGDKVYFRNAASEVTGFSTSSSYYNFFMAGSIAASGNVMSLVDQSCQTTTIPCDFCFSNLFNGCTSLTSAPTLPATTLTTYCYSMMFLNCHSLTTAPALPATTLANYCYNYMFNGCSSLTTAPALPATTLMGYCYESMFRDCSALTTAPELPATTLADRCYHYMFKNCSALTTAPALPATTLTTYCYQYMFQDCTSLTTAPALPATTLADYCYDRMFCGCTSLTKAPALPATTLAPSCYTNMFQNCSALTTAPELPATTLADKCYQYMFQDCTSLTKAPALPATTLGRYCYYNMFYGCTSLTTAPELPATALAYYCYQNMFYGCTSLTTAPELPATKLASSCYKEMFSGCTSLNNISVAFSTTTTSYTNNWVKDVASNGTFTCPEGLTGTGVSKIIPTGWTVKNTYDLAITSETGWASMCVNLPLQVPTGVEVYYASAVEGSTITLTQIPEGTVMAPRTAVIVKGAKGTVGFPIVAAAGTSYPDNLFQGSSVAKPCNARENYVLNASKSTDEKVHFSIYTGTTLTDHKAYLPMSAVGGATESIQFRFDGATAISTIEMESRDDAIYNLAGQRVGSDYRGIVIKNGKKMFNL